MRFHRLPVTVLTTIVAGTLCAQSPDSSRYSLGVEAGTTYTRIRSISASAIEAVNLPDDHQQFSLGYYAGATGVFRWTDHVHLSLGVQYLTRKIKYTLEEGSFTDSDDVIVPSHAQMRHSTHTVSLPLEAQYRFGDNMHGFVAGIGGVASFYLGTQEQYQVYADQDDAELGQDKVRYRSDSFSSWNFFLRFSAGYDLPLNDALSMGITLAYHQGLTDLLSSEALFNTNHRMNYFQGGIRLTHSL